MAFTKLTPASMPPRQWALVGYPGSGKSTFAAQLRAPALVIDADHRFAEVMPQAAGEVWSISEDPADHVDARRIAELLRRNMPGAGVRTVIVDSVTAILSPLITEAIMSNDAGENKNRIGAFKDKALSMRTLQDAITSWGTDTLWIYHYRDARDSNAHQTRGTTIPAVELARLRRSLNLQLSMVEEAGRRGVRVDWARRGRAGLTLWDTASNWRGMPERIEAEVYAGLSAAEQSQIERTPPATFAGPAEAIAWAYDWAPTAWKDAVHTQHAYDALKAARRPTCAAEMWAAWVAEVQKRAEASAIPATTTRTG